MAAPLHDHVQEDDELTLNRLGYTQELLRRMSGFSNYAISMSIICILAGGVTSFHNGFCSVGGASIGIGWPLVCAFSMTVALTMGQIASAFPTAGGLYHWASILGGRGWGWITAWFNLAGLVTVLTAINVGLYRFAVSSFRLDPDEWGGIPQLVAITAITISQAYVNHRGIRLTTILTDFSGYWILVVASVLTIAVLVCAKSYRVEHLILFENFSGENGGNVWPRQSNIVWLFILGFSLPAYTITGFDASAHTSEETMGASITVPRSIVRSVLVSGLAGWMMLAAIVITIPGTEQIAVHGSRAFTTALDIILPPWLSMSFYIGIGIAQYLCGLATVTSASRMLFAFARDEGTPFSHLFRQVSQVYRVPVFSIWAVAIASVAFTIYTPIYTTITLVCVIFLYISYVIPTALGLVAYERTWTKFGPWTIGRWFRPLAVISVAGCGLLIAIGMVPPNTLAIWVVLSSSAVLAIFWFAWERKRFQGPPNISTMGELNDDLPSKPR